MLIVLDRELEVERDRVRAAHESHARGVEGEHGAVVGLLRIVVAPAGSECRGEE